MENMKFKLKQTVRIAHSEEIALVVGRAEFVAAENAYFLRYENKSKITVTQMWGESAIELFNTPLLEPTLNNRQVTNQDATKFYIEQLKPWVTAQMEPFTLKETLEFLSLNPEIDSTLHALPAIVEALGALGLVNIGDTFTREPRRVSKDEIIT